MAAQDRLVPIPLNSRAWERGRAGSGMLLRCPGRSPGPLLPRKGPGIGLVANTGLRQPTPHSTHVYTSAVHHPNWPRYAVFYSVQRYL